MYLFARALHVLRDGGWLAFMTSRKYLRAAYDEGPRSHLPASLAIERAIDFGGLPMFDNRENPAPAHPAVVVGKKESRPSTPAASRT